MAMAYADESHNCHFPFIRGTRMKTRNTPTEGSILKYENPYYFIASYDMDSDTIDQTISLFYLLTMQRLILPIGECNVITTILFYFWHKR